MTQRITTILATLTVVAAVAVSATVGVGAVAANTSPPVDDEYAVIQGDECIPIESLGYGHQTTEEYYDYRAPHAGADASTYSSHGTTHLQEDDTSVIFLHESSNGLSLVMVHDQYNGDSDGGAATFQLTDLPQDGEWVVEDDDYDGSETEWDHRGTSSRISWAWSEERTDGAAFNGGLDDDFEINIYPLFNDQAALSGIYDGEVTDWQALSGPEHNPERTSLNMTQPITITSESCSSYTVTEINIDEPVLPGERTEIEATIENYGESNETYPVRFTVDGETVDEQDLMLEPGENTTVSTSIEFDETGTYTVGIVDATKEVTVSEEDDEMVGFGAIAAIAALLVALVARHRF